MAGRRFNVLRNFVERTIKLIAKQSLTYAGRDFHVGDVFLTEPIEAARLTYQRKAQFAPKDAEPTPEPEPEPTRIRRRYRTRQMKAEA